MLHYVTEIRHQVNKLRPELLKPPKKSEVEEETLNNDAGKFEEAVAPPGEQPQEQESKQRKDDMRESPAPQSVEEGGPTVDENSNLGPALAAILEKEHEERQAELAAEEKLEVKASNMARSKRELAEAEKFRMEDMQRRERLERVVGQINADLASIMNDLVGQSKAQTQLLNQLVDQTTNFQSGGPRRNEGAPQAPPSKGAQNADPDVVRLAQNAPPELTNATRDASCWRQACAPAGRPV